MASILISEADPDVRQLLKVLLTRLGHEAIVLGGGFDMPPPADLLLLEPTSPDCLEQAWLVRMYDPAIPVVCVSVLPEAAQFLTLGPLGYLTKPFTLEQLRGVLDRALAPALNP